MFAMDKNSEIPCCFCQKWDPKAKKLFCNPNNCKKVSEWLLDHAHIEPMEIKRVDIQSIQYVI
jgi:hypothetical protein